MRAKFRVMEARRDSETQETLDLMAVSDKPFDTEGVSDDNTFARWTPCGRLSITIQNPALLGKFKEGEKYYLDLTKAGQ